MVYGKILYNNIKEYTPKWFPTIPYSQTVKPTFGNSPIMQFVSLRWSPDGTRSRSSSVDGGWWARFSNTVGPISFLYSVWPSDSGQLSTIPLSMSISQITSTGGSLQPSQRRKLIRKS